MNLAPIGVSRWLHRFAILVAVCMLFLVLTGAAVTGNQLLDTPTPDAHMMRVFHRHITAHRHGAGGFGLLAVVLGVWLMTRPSFRGLGAGMVILTLSETLIGQFFLNSGVSAFFHAFLAQLLFALSVAATVVTTPSWQNEPAFIPDRGWPSLRGFAALTCALVFVQVALGAAYRHELIGVLWHIIGALLLALFILGTAMLSLGLPPESVPQGNPLKPPAILLIVATCLQLILGLIIVSLAAKALHSPIGMYLTVIHTTNGSLTLACIVILTLAVRRHMRREAK